MFPVPSFQALGALRGCLGKVQAVGGGGGKDPWEVSWEWEGAWGGVQTNVLLKAGSALRSWQVLEGCIEPALGNCRAGAPGQPPATAMSLGGVKPPEMQDSGGPG